MPGGHEEQAALLDDLMPNCRNAEAITRLLLLPIPCFEGTCSRSKSGAFRDPKFESVKLQIVKWCNR